MIKYACDFSQSETEKCFEWIIMSDSCHFQDENLLLPSWSCLMTGQNWVLKRLLSTLGTLIRLITRPSYYFINVCRSQVCKIVLDTSFDRNNENMPGLFKHLQHAENIALIRLEFTKCSCNAESRCWAVKQRLIMTNDELTYTFYWLHTLLLDQLIVVGFGFGFTVIRK